MTAIVINKNSTAYKALRAVVFVSISAGLTSLIQATKSDPTLFGSFTVIINGVLVVIWDQVKNVIAPSTPPQV